MGEKNKEMEEVRRDLEQAKTNNQGKDDEVRVFCKDDEVRVFCKDDEVRVFCKDD